MRITKTLFTTFLVLLVTSNFVLGQQDTTFTIDSTGNIGVGTALPVEKLDIDADAAVGLKIGSAGYGSLIRYDRDKDKYSFFTGVPDELNSRWDIQDAFNNPLFSVHWEGNVGIGTPEPNNLLTLHKDADIWHLALGNVIDGGEQLRLGVPSGLGYAAIGAFNTFDNSGPIHLLLQRDGGHVGIGIANPTATLHIGTGGIRFPDGSYQTSATVGSVGSLSNNLDAVVTADADGDGSGAIRLQVAGNDKLHITNSGNVGIGANIMDPNFQLSVGSIRNGMYTSDHNFIIAQGTNSARILALNSVGDIWLNMDSNDNDADTKKLVIAKNDTLTGGTPLMTIQEAGNVGIGITNPEAKLHVYDASDAGEIRLSGETSGAVEAIHNSLNFYRRLGSEPHARIVTVQDGADIDQVGLALYTHSYIGDNTPPDEVMRINSSGNVGIGTTTPADKLEVVDSRTNSLSSQLLGLKSLSTHSDGDARLRFTLRAGSGDDRLGEIVAYKTNNDGVNYIIRTNDDGTVVEALRILKNGNISTSNNQPTAELDIDAPHGYDQLRLRASYTPANSGDPNGHVGDFSWDDNFIYVKTNDGWKRAALSAW